MLDVPGKPQGPLSYTDIAGDAITLHWGSPKDDGGSPITNYVIEKKNSRTGEWDKVGQSIGVQFRVRGLENGSKYEFRVRAENQYGVGEPLEADSSVQAKNPFGEKFNFLKFFKTFLFLDVPDPPGQPEPINTTDDSITLQWLRPLHDGGAAITGYTLEKREVGAAWEKASFGNISETRFRVTNLVAQKTYEFRVAAINAAGQSDWSENSVPIVASSGALKPRISMGMLARDLTAFVGDPAKILVPFAASPRPEIQWSRNNGIIFDERDSRALIESNDYLTQLSYRKCERTDSGTYVVRVSVIIKIRNKLLSVLPYVKQKKIS